MELTFKQIVMRLNIAVSTAKNIYSPFEITGDVETKLSCPRRELRKLGDIMELLVLGVILENPSLYLSDVCEKIEELSGISVPQTTICRLLKGYGLTRKKV